MKRFKGKMSRGDSLLGLPSGEVTYDDIKVALADVTKLLEDLQNQELQR